MTKKTINVTPGTHRRVRQKQGELNYRHPTEGGHGWTIEDVVVYLLDVEKQVGEGGLDADGLDRIRRETLDGRNK